MELGLPADKGHAMETDNYRTKMSTLVENGPYQLLNKEKILDLMAGTLREGARFEVLPNRVLLAMTLNRNGV